MKVKVAGKTWKYVVEFEIEVDCENGECEVKRMKNDWKVNQEKRGKSLANLRLSNSVGVEWLTCIALIHKCKVWDAI